MEDEALSNPLNVQTNKVAGRRNLLKHGKIISLLTEMEEDALENKKEAEETLYQWSRCHGYGRSLGSHALKLEEDVDIQAAAYELARSIRKYAPFIEVGAMTIAEAISCETQKQAAMLIQKHKAT